MKIFILELWVLFFLMGCNGKKSTGNHTEYAARKDLQFLAMCVDAYVLKNGEFPKSLFLATMVFEDQTPEHWKISKKAIDPWGSPYHMFANSESFQIRSFGANRLDDSGQGDDIYINKSLHVPGKIEQNPDSKNSHSQTK
jgi:hypothetical protein